jgi:hypothetical protein
MASSDAQALRTAVRRTAQWLVLRNILGCATWKLLCLLRKSSLSL